MNIICNNCAGGYFYRDVLKEEYQNPFIWTQICAKEFVKLIENFDKINFLNYEMLEMKKSDFIESGDFGEHIWLNQHPLGLRIDNIFTLWFPHIRYKIDAIKPQTVNTDIYYYRHFELVVDTYEKRLKRMKENPVFMILDYEWFGWNEELIKQVIDLSNTVKYKIIILTKRKEIKINNAKIIYNENLHYHPSIAVKEEGNKIKEFLGIK